MSMCFGSSHFIGHLMFAPPQAGDDSGVFMVDYEGILNENSVYLCRHDGLCRLAEKIGKRPISGQGSVASMIIEIAKTILLVEDEAVTAAAQARSLEKNGFNVITAYNGEKAVECATGNSKIDLILMDIDLGAGMDGTQAAAIILIHGYPAALPRAILSRDVERTGKITTWICREEY